MSYVYVFVVWYSGYVSFGCKLVVFLLERLLIILYSLENVILDLYNIYFIIFSGCVKLEEIEIK